MPSTAISPARAPRSWAQNTDAQLVWEHALAHLQLQISPAQYETYLRSTIGIAYDPGASVLRVAAANPFHIPWLEGRTSSVVHTVIAEVLGAPVRVEFVCESPPGGVGSPTADRPRPAQLRPLDALLSESRPPVGTPTEQLASVDAPAADRPAAPPQRQLQGSPLNPRYTFQSFVVGKSNQLAQAASMAVVDDPGRSYNPLFLYGGVGLGKTHLLHAIGHAVMAKGLPVVYVSSETFTNDLIEAIRHYRTDDFRAKYRRARLLLIDDVQFIAGKERTEEEFFHTFNAIHEAGGQIVLSSDRAPRAMSILEDRLRSRFEWGLIADIQPPDYETRIAILRSKVTGSIMNMVPLDVLDFIAQKVQSNIRELEGSLNRLVAYARDEQRPITVDLAARALKDMLAPGPASNGVTAASIMIAVSRYFGVTQDDLKGKSRQKQIVVPRQIAMYLLSHDAHMSTPEVGRVLNRDHTTVLHGMKLIAGDIARDGPSRSAIRGVREVLAVAHPPPGLAIP